MIFEVLKIWVVRPMEPGVGESLRPKERARDKAKGKEREVQTLEQEEVIGRLEEGKDMQRRRIAQRIAERWVDLEMLMDEIEGLEGLLENEE